MYYINENNTICFESSFSSGIWTPLNSNWLQRRVQTHPNSQQLSISLRTFQPVSNKTSWLIYLFYENPNSTLSGLWFEITRHGNDDSPQYLGSNFIDTVEMTKSTRFTSSSWFSNVTHYWYVILCLTNITEDGYRNIICYMPIEVGGAWEGAWEILAWGNFNLSSNNYKIESLIQTS